ncbi:MAG: type II toxin-antitoxin system HicB family antitoxin [Pseudomonadota bacterium]
MLIPVAIHKEKDSAYGVIVPDLPGCHSAGDTLDEAIENAREAIEFHIEGLILESEPLPEWHPLQHHKQSGQYEDAEAWVLIDLDLTKYSSAIKRINITVPEFVLNQIDQYSKSVGKSRSSVLTEGALQLVTRKQ